MNQPTIIPLKPILIKNRVSMIFVYYFQTYGENRRIPIDYDGLRLVSFMPPPPRAEAWIETANRIFYRCRNAGIEERIPLKQGLKPTSGSVSSTNCVLKTVLKGDKKTQYLVREG